MSNELIDGGLSSRVSPHTRRFKWGPLVHTSAGVDEHDRRTCDVLEVYAAALQAVSDGEDPRCRLHWPDGRVTDVDIARWLAKPTGCELAAMDRLSGPALDGCGPGRHVLALNAGGVECLGIDVLPTAVRWRAGAAPTSCTHLCSVICPQRDGSPRCCSTATSGSARAPSSSFAGSESSCVRAATCSSSSTPTSRASWTLRFELATADLHSRPFMWTLVGLEGIASLAVTTGYDIADVRDDGSRSFAHHIARGADA